MLSFGSSRVNTAGPGPGSLKGVPLKKSAPHLQECGYYDVQQVHQICRALLYTLGAASVEKTTGDPFNHPATVVGDVRKEMIEFVQHQVDAYATSSSGSQSHDSVKVVQEILESFVKSKRSIFRRVSSKILLSEKQDEKIEDFVQELERTGGWIMGQREVLAKAYLKRVDRSKMNHCVMKFESNDELAGHKSRCPLRPLMCENDSCGEVISALHVKAHDETCPYKPLPCQQKCKATVLRGEMSIHCTTVCPMKLVDCPFHQVGCVEPLPQIMVEQHYSQSMGAHLLLVLQALREQEISVSNQAQRILLLEKAISLSQRSEAVDIGSMSLALEEQETKIKALEQEVAKLRQDVKVIDVSADVLQLRRELRNLHKQAQAQSQQTLL